ncbi:unnamed protein product [Polarella glacialis]|nr:unnamed protein product [Polarella glacialis]
MLKESQVSSADPSQPPVNKAIIVMIDKPSQEVCVPVELCAPGEQPLLQSKADEAKAAEAALDALRVVVSQSFDQWRGQRRRVMGEAYKDFCSARDLICHDNFAAVRSVANVWALPLDLQTAIATWCTNEQRGLEPSFEQWEQEETRALDKAFAAWTEEHRCAVAGERARILQELRSQARSELEAWKGQERAALLQDAGRATAAADSDKEIFRQELCKQMQLLRSADARAAAAETECEELRKRAQRAEAALRAERVASVARAQTRPVFQSVRGERLTKRVRVEHHPCLQGYVGDLCTKINRALEDGKITQRQAHKCHEIRMEGNRAAHERQGCFGTQVGPGEQDPLSEPTDPGAWDPGSDYGGEYGEESDCDSCDSCDSRFGV